MITRSDLRKTARDYLTSAAILRQRGKYDVSVYLCGYAVEIALKDRTCRTLHWAEFPDTSGEFSGLVSFKTHTLEVLLRLSGFEQPIKTKMSAEWSTVEKWNPEQRYKPRGAKSQADTDDMIRAARMIVKALLGS